MNGLIEYRNQYLNYMNVKYKINFLRYLILFLN
jgi:hypothetical protein